MAGRGNNLAKRRDETDLQWRSRLARLKAEERDRSEPLVPHEAQRHGDYQDDTLYSVNDNGQIVRAAVKRNRGGTPICRWIEANKLTSEQLGVINWCQRLWRMAGISQRVTANYGERIGGMGCIELSAANEIEARQDLHRLQGYVPRPYWDVFENVCRHGIPAGHAGSTLGFGERSANDRAHTIVCFVADIVAMKEGL